jgi:hypothetical protein
MAPERVAVRPDAYNGRARMRSSASETLEIIRIVEQSHLPVRRTLADRDPADNLLPVV